MSDESAFERVTVPLAVFADNVTLWEVFVAKSVSPTPSFGKAVHHRDFVWQFGRHIDFVRTP